MFLFSWLHSSGVEGLVVLPEETPTRTERDALRPSSTLHGSALDDMWMRRREVSNGVRFVQTPSGQSSGWCLLFMLCHVLKHQAQAERREEAKEGLHGATQQDTVCIAKRQASRSLSLAFIKNKKEEQRKNASTPTYLSARSQSPILTSPSTTGLHSITRACAGKSSHKSPIPTAMSSCLRMGGSNPGLAPTGTKCTSASAF